MADAKPAKAGSGSRRVRDPRLDFFRGAGMFIILFAHTPGSVVTDWIPARFGFSDATEIFVFCSGVASAYAFGRAFDTDFRAGVVRILRRLRQIYLAHVAVFVSVVALLGLADRLIPGAAYLRHDLNLAHFLDDPLALSAHFLTLTYVPNYFDILPMYLVILAMIPAMILLARRSPLLAMGTSVLLWALSQAHVFDLPAEPWSSRKWFFDAFAWQVVFFAGFAYGRRWLPVPRADLRWVMLAAAVLVFSAPVSCQYGFACYAGWGHVPAFGTWHDALTPLIDKTHVGVLRLVHFCALAYLAYLIAGSGQALLHGRVARVVCRVGTQTLPVFLCGLVLAQALGVAIDLSDDGVLAQVLINVAGCGILVLVAEASRKLKNAASHRAHGISGREAAVAS